MAAASARSAPASTIDEGYHGHARPEMLPFVPADARRVLDLGCGEGIFGASVRARGAEVWGIELSAEAGARAAKRLDRVLVGDAEAQLDALPDGAFDCVACNDVLEHLPEPGRVLQRLRPKLSERGVVVASIPNVRWLPNLYNLIVRKDWKYEDEGVLDRTHLRFFTQRSMARMFEESGYEVQSMRGINRMGGWKPTVVDVATLGLMRDAKWQQFACIARPRRA